MSRAATAAAARIGRRAGDVLRDQGVPTRNPFPDRPELARAWARGYLSAIRPRRARPQLEFRPPFPT